MKRIHFQVIDLSEQDPNPTLTVRDALALASEGSEFLREQLNKLLENAKEDKFDYRELLLAHLRSPKWNDSHKMTDIEKIELAIRVRRVLEDKENDTPIVDTDVANYLCDLAADIDFRPGARVEQLEASLGFVEYFKSVRKDEGKASAEDFEEAEEAEPEPEKDSDVNEEAKPNKEKGKE